jgi:PhnB protein
MKNAQYRTVTPYLKLPNSGQLVDFLKTAFEAVEKDRLSKPDGTLLHAEIVIGDTLLMVHELPAPGTPKPCTLYLRADNTDATFKQAHRRESRHQGSLATGQDGAH